MIELGTQLENIDHKIHQAMRAIQTEKRASSAAKESVRHLCDRSEALLKDLRGEANPRALLKGVEELEELGDQAKDAAKSDQQRHVIAKESFQKVLNAHNSIRQLRDDVAGVAASTPMSTTEKARTAVSSAVSSATAAASTAASTVASSASAATSKVRSTVDSVVQSTSGTAVGSKVQSATQSVASKASDVATSVASTVKSTAATVKNKVANSNIQPTVSRVVKSTPAKPVLFSVAALVATFVAFRLYRRGAIKSVSVGDVTDTLTSGLSTGVKKAQDYLRSGHGDVVSYGGMTGSSGAGVTTR